PLSKIPGPFISRVSPMWLAYQARMGRRYLAVNELHKMFGKIVRISPHHISISDYAEIETVYGQGTRALDKSKFYDAFVCEKASVFSTTDRNEHSKKRKFLSRAFSYESLRKCTLLIEISLQQFVQELDKTSNTGELINLLDWLNYLAFDMLSDLAFGEEIGMVKKHSDIVEVQRSNGKIEQEHAISLVDEREHLSVIIGVWPSLGKIAKWIPDPLFRKGYKSSTGLADFARRCITKRLETQTRRADLLTKLIDAHGEMADVQTESFVELTAETITLLIAGSDTTSSSLTAIIFLTLTHQPVSSKLVENLESEIGDRSLTYDLVKNIPYLDAVIYEGLRYHATTAIGLHRVVPSGGIVCCGYEIPEGTEVSIPAFTIQRDPEIWGDPENFRPERWLGSDDLKPYLLTFGRGPRACVSAGHLAFIEMRLILAQMMLRYKIELKEKSMPTIEGFMHKPQRLMATLERRNRMSRDEL
ncbi:benzoate para-hydroxylase, partial [Cyathus striatus]